MKSYRFHPDALAEFLAALDWYQGRWPAAADTLGAAVEVGIETIRRFPQASPPIVAVTIRARNLDTFGYSIVYFVEHDEVVILAIAHQRRRARYWLSRAQR